MASQYKLDCLTICRSGTPRFEGSAHCRFVCRPHTNPCGIVRRSHCMSLAVDEAYRVSKYQTQAPKRLVTWEFGSWNASTSTRDGYFFPSRHQDWQFSPQTRGVWVRNTPVRSLVLPHGEEVVSRLRIAKSSFLFLF